MQYKQSEHKLKPGGQISISKNMAEAFRLQSRKEVLLYVVQDRAKVTLDLVELSFKEQYAGRSQLRSFSQ